MTSITLGVPDVTLTGRFYLAFGLTETSPAGYATRHGGEQLRLQQAPYRQLLRLGVGVDDPDDIERVRASLVRHDASLRVQHAADRLCVVEPRTRVIVDVVVVDRYRHDPGVPPPVNTPGAHPRLNRPADPVLRDDAVRPSKLSHVVLVSPDWDATTRFFTDGVGFSTSDEVVGLMSFLRCSDMHHNLLIQQGPGVLLHHTAWEVDDVDDVGRGASRLVEADPDCHIWGLGRHAIGSNYFWYLRDPAGNFAEYAADFDRISDDDLYRPKHWAPHELLAAWSPPTPAAFLEPDDAADIFASQA